MRKVWAVLLVIVLLGCTGCAVTEKKVSEGQDKSEEKTSEITIPETYLNFTDQNTEGLAESFEEYCQDVKIDESNLVIKVTETQRKKLMEIYDEYKDEVIKKFKAVDENYECEIAEDYSRITYEYDEKLYKKDENESTHIQAELLTGVISSCAINQILERNNPDWEITVIVKNCHTGNVVAETVLPKGEFFIGADEWTESYK